MCCKRSELEHIIEQEDRWSCIAHMSAEDMLNSAVIEEKKFKHSPWLRQEQTTH